MGGSLDPRTDDPEFATHPRHEFNFWFDPEAAHIVLRAPFPRIDLTTVDISIKTQFTQAMLAPDPPRPPPPRSTSPNTPTTSTTSGTSSPPALCSTPPSSPSEQILYLDVDTTPGPNYGDTLSWTAANRPQLPLQPVHVQTDLDLPRFTTLFISLMKSPPQ